MRALRTLSLIVGFSILVSCAGLPFLSGAKQEFEQGLALFNAGKYEQAIPYFTKAAELDQNYVQAYVYLGRSYKNQLPPDVFYKVFVFAADDSFTGLAASGQTRDTSISLPIDPTHAGQIACYITLVDATGTQLEHGQCNPSFSATLLTVNPPDGLKAVFFHYQP